MEVSQRIRAFVSTTKFNLWGAFIGAGFEVFGLATNVGKAYVAHVAFVATAFFLGRIAWTQYWEAERYREQLSPKFDITFFPDQGRPYLQTLEFGSVPGSGFPMVKMKDRRYRVGIVNLSTGIVPGVRLVLDKCEPSDNFVHVGHRLQVMDSDPILGERDLPPSPDGAPTLWFDVVQELGRGDEVPSEFSFCYANPNICGPVEGECYDITLRAEGAGVSKTRSFRITKEFGGDPYGMRRLNMVSV